MTFTIRALATLVCGRNSVELIVKRLDFLSLYVYPLPDSRFQLMYIVDLRNIQRFKKSYDAITKLLVTKFELQFEITWSETDFFSWLLY